MNTIKRQTVFIKLLDENGEISMQWQLSNAWPTKITSTNLVITAFDITELRYLYNRPKTSRNICVFESINSLAD